MPGRAARGATLSAALLSRQQRLRGTMEPPSRARLSGLTLAHQTAHLTPLVQSWPCGEQKQPITLNQG